MTQLLKVQWKWYSCGQELCTRAAAISFKWKPVLRTWPNVTLESWRLDLARLHIMCHYLKLHQCICLVVFLYLLNSWWFECSCFQTECFQIHGILRSMLLWEKSQIFTFYCEANSDIFHECPVQFWASVGIGLPDCRCWVLTLDRWKETCARIHFPVPCLPCKAVPGLHSF